MELEFLGTGAGLPAKHRNVTSIALRLLAERNAVWLFDCGEGTQMQILHTTIKPRKIEKIFISHLHGDHIFGLPGLITSRSNQAGDKPLEIYGPRGLEDFIRTSLKISKTHLNYPLKFIEISSDEQTLFEDEQFIVSCKKLDHGIASYGFRVTEKDHKGELQVEKLKALGIQPGPVYGKLKQGESITLADGRIVEGKDFVGEDKKGRIVTILGDTRYTTNAIALAEDADVLVHESTFNKHEEKLAKSYYHSTTQQAAKVAKKAGVNQLILTHISARYLNKDAIELEKEAQEVFSQTTIAKDFYWLEIPFQAREES
ncbi:ribonuclease Z [Tetragenococcus osmophilus]|uniref:Ribonuclease Z n=1 Tax=Tetragenococcus osmophilus TaxID=526944 RepID=A0AA37XJJ5_9ENTE|nr:ribonuclease Z [Tetragenococcus osmophilus]AYW48527.1 ribonuclease Z [Tetragenococcus osmophilus]GMA54413.1 ribonuclease Z [Alicyclobacillus contaminans]GMA71733.1 ribonuclease Z [Tetragenococcus osmophilus]